MSFVVMLCHLSAPAWPQLCPNVPAMPGQGTSHCAVLGGAPPGPSPDPKPQLLLAHPKTCSNAAWHCGTHPNPWGSGSRPCTLTCIHTCTHVCTHRFPAPTVQSGPGAWGLEASQQACVARHMCSHAHTDMRLHSCAHACTCSHVCMCMHCMHTLT